MKKIAFVLPCFLFVFFHLYAQHIVAKKTVVPQGTLLKYDFSKAYLYRCNKSKSGNIYVCHHYKIFKFDSTGNLLKIIPAPHAKTDNGGILDFVVSKDEKNIYMIGAVSGKLISLNVLTNKIDYSVELEGSNIRMDENGILYAQYQDVSPTGSTLTNRIWVYEQSGKNYTYPNKWDLLSDGFEIIRSNIVAYAADDSLLYQLPIINNKQDKAKYVKFSVDMNWGIIVGYMDDHYIFRYYDGATDNDIVAIYDDGFKLIRKYRIPLRGKDIVNEDFPANFERSGNHYYYDNNNHIYFLRNTKKGAFVYTLKDFLK